MITYSKHILTNGLTVILHEDKNTPLATVNLLYNVGARDEDPARTGFAHLFEHLMFGGTEQVPDYDIVVDGMSGENNAYTTNDYTNYYITIPAEHVRRALWLEADRMRGLALNQKALEVQQSVVTEEYHQRYENQPYGDIWMLLRPMCYKKHPYRWNTIGADIRHVSEATLEDVKRFFQQFYCPDNAILCVAGNIDSQKTLNDIEELFGDIPSSGLHTSAKPKAFARLYPQEEEQVEERRLVVHRPVPNDALYMCFPMCDRQNDDFVTYDIISDLLSNGGSSRLIQQLVKKEELFTEINAYISGESGPGLFIVSARMREGVDIALAEKKIWQELDRIATEKVDENELLKVVNKYEATFEFSQYKAADRANALCHFEWLGAIEQVNKEPQRYRKVTPDDVLRVASSTFKPTQCSILHYLREE